MAIEVTNANGQGLGITTDHRVMLQNFDRNFDLGNGMDNGWSFSSYFVALTPTAGLVRRFAMLQNNSADPLVVTGFMIRDAGAEVISLEVTTANWLAAGAAAVPVVNRHQGSVNVFTTKGNFYNGVNITGMVANVEIHRFAVAANADRYIDLTKNPIVLGENARLLWVSNTSGTAVNLSVDCYYAMLSMTNA